MGRPSAYTPEIGAVICARIADGQSLRRITSDGDMPCSVTVYKWLALHEPFMKQYTRAREDQADTFADAIVDIADGEDEPDNKRVRIDARKWAAGKLRPKKYADRSVVGGDPDNPVVHVHEVRRSYVKAGE